MKHSTEILQLSKMFPNEYALHAYIKILYVKIIYSIHIITIIYNKKENLADHGPVAL